jgi:phosphatidate cytidylyltransferase
MHLKRWITGLALLPLLIGAILYGAWPFALFVTAVALLALREYLQIVLRQAAPATARGLHLPALAAAALVVLAAHAAGAQAALLLLALAPIFGGAVVLWRYGADPAAVEWQARQALGLLYIPLPLACIIWLRAMPGGAARVLLLLVVIFTSDIGALYFGIALGRRKLCPGISPGKTVAGSLGGLATSLGCALAFNALAPRFPSALAMAPLPWGGVVLLALVLAMAGQAGDLFESVLKRRAQVKDSGTLLPGHGGMLDRIDALLFAAPLAYGLMRLME